MEQKTLLKNKKNQGNGGETTAKRDDSVKKKVPELRFTGFTDDWEERKLAEFTTSFSGGTPSAGNSSYYKGDIPFIRSGEINSDKTELFLTEDGLKNSSAKMVSVGDILYALYGATSGEVGISQINGAINQAILAIRPIGGYSSHFIMQWLRLQKQKIIDKYLQGGQGNLSGSIIKNLILNVPNFEEQQKIGSFFKQLDDTIALHQRKLDLLKEQKKGFLQKIFPKNGSKVPELRFAGFADDWEQRKAGDIFKNVSDKGYSDLPVLSASQELGMIRRDEIGIDIKYDEASTKNYKRVQPGQFVIHLRSFQGGFAWSDIEGITSPAYTVLDYKEPNRYNSDFWKIVLTSPTFITRLETVTYGIRDGRSISYTDFSSLKLTAPSLAEQQQIGAFFAHLDTLISLHQRKLDLLKEQKKGFLQKMFV